MAKTMSLSIHHVFLSLLLCFVLQKPTQAIKQSYIVYLGSHSFGANPSSVDVESVTNSHYELLGQYVGSTEMAKEAILYSYNRHVNGFAAVLDEDEAVKIAEHPNVVSVFVSKVRKLHTTHSWNFLGVERANGILGKASIWRKSYGQDIIIGNLDTGVWPESKSFSDEGMGPIPKRWRGICQTDKLTQDNFRCNRKLIGARYFTKGYEANHKEELNATFHSARDRIGHGSHTLSTAGGNFVHGASVFGNGNGTASGGSPKARVAAYKVCWGDCDEADILAGFEAAISDGVDVISMSLGGKYPVEFFQDAISIGSFHAVANNIVVVCSAGNNGPNPKTIVNVEPWTFTVAAGTTDRDFSAYVTLGNKKILKGTSLSECGTPSDKLYPLISAVDAKAENAPATLAANCGDKCLDPTKVKGKIVICLGFDDRISKGVEAVRAGAVGMILANDKSTGNEVRADPHVLPVSHVNFNDGTYIFNYINHTKSPMASISQVKTELGRKPAPAVASFSSRGPNALDPAILKPDIIAPGVNIIAAYSEATSPSGEESDKQKTPFMSLLGTSMSCPHVAGLVGLLKAIHPRWSPAAIKRLAEPDDLFISTPFSATTLDNTRGLMVDSATLGKATPFDYGAGHIQPNDAVDPGLVYDLNTIDYANYLCGHGYNTSLIKAFYGKPYNCPKSFNLANLNYPSITVELVHSVNVTRTLTNVGTSGTYTVQVEAPPQVTVSVEPQILRFEKEGEKREFRITLTLKQQTKKNETNYGFGRLVWTDRKHYVKSPIIVKYPQH